MIDVKLTGKEFTTVHNALCELDSMVLRPALNVKDVIVEGIANET